MAPALRRGGGVGIKHPMHGTRKRRGGGRGAAGAAAARRGAGHVPAISFGSVSIVPEIREGWLHSLGRVRVAGTDLRGVESRFLPWFDTYEGDVFDRFRVRRLVRRGRRRILELTAQSSSDYPFREKRDSSGDPAFRATSWDAPGLQADVRVVLEPARDTVDGLAFEGFRYWYEIRSPRAPVHRLLDRQTWELGGRLDRVTLILRNWLTPPRVPLRKSTSYSTAGHEKLIGCMPGNLWARWSLLPAFDLQTSPRGVLFARFDRVSLIRTLMETARGEDALRCLDMHYFESGRRVRTNPKTILFCPAALDATDTLNLWTRLHDRERDRARGQLGIRDEAPPQLNLCHNDWVNVRFDRNYRDVVELAAKVNADNVMIDPIWESGQTILDDIAALRPTEALGRPSALDKFTPTNQCAVMDWTVDPARGGEPALKTLCADAAARGVGILSWFGAHMAPYSRWRHGQHDQGFGRGAFGVFAAKESGRHPDTGYPGDCWPLNLLTPMKAHVLRQVRSIFRRTGLRGLLWDSFSNLGWWQLDYSGGTMKPQFGEMADLYAQLVKSGLYLMPEAICAFSSHSCLGLHGGDPYAGEMLGYAYDSNIHMPSVPGGSHYDGFADCEILKGRAPVDELFRCLAHRRAPNLSISRVPPEQRDPGAIEALRGLFSVYKKVRGDMHRRTVLKGGRGVHWVSANGRRQHLFVFKRCPAPAGAVDVATGQPVVSRNLDPGRVYRLAGGQQAGQR